MKDSDQWAEFIIKYLGDHPVTSIEAAKAQIKMIIEMVQDDIIGVAAGADNQNDPNAAA